MHAGGRVPRWAPVPRRHTPRHTQGCAAVPVLYDAADRGDLETVCRALVGGADVNHQPDGRHGNTALHRAASNGHVEVVRELVRAGADVNALTRPRSPRGEGWTPLHMACHSGQRGASPKTAPGPSLLTPPALPGLTTGAACARQTDHQLSHVQWW
jgi:hypothetical protein